MYIARGVCLGVVSTDEVYRVAPRMPELSDEARALYAGVYGEARYERYNDRDGTRHGARPPDMDEEYETAPQFFHRPEHDVESVYWSMVSALLRVHPKGVDKEAEAAENMISTWTLLLGHKIPKKGFVDSDSRQAIVTKTQEPWRGLFLDKMKDVGTLLWKISRHVVAEYALWGDGLQPDHLHEAVQRLILQYLIDHKDPIELEPDYLRPIRDASTQDSKQVPSQRISTMATGTGTVSREKRTTRASARSSQTRVDAESGTGSRSKRKSVDIDVAQSASSSGTRVSGSSRPIVVDPKRKGSGQTGRSSKRLRANLGLPQSIGERAEGDP